MASALLYTPFRFGLGVGLKLGFEIPLVHNGFIPRLNNSFSLEPSFAFGWNRYRGGRLFGAADLDAIELTPAVSVLWSFYFSPKFRAYAAVHLGLTVLNPYVSEGDDSLDIDASYHFHGELAPGIVYAFNERVAIRAELGWWSGAKFGVSIFL